MYLYHLYTLLYKQNKLEVWQNIYTYHHILINLYNIYTPYTPTIDQAIISSKCIIADIHVHIKKKCNKAFPLHLKIFFTILKSASKGTKVNVHMNWNAWTDEMP